jgi:acetoacetyl-CoA synthetase
LAVIGGNNLIRIHGNELAAAALGMKVEIWDENGNNIDDSGQKGELVITKPFPSMPVTFWGEGGDEKYRNAYFDTFPNVWCHGDFVSRDIKTKGYLVHGRSDGVLNPGGESSSLCLYFDATKLTAFKEFGLALPRYTTWSADSPRWMTASP